MPRIKQKLKVATEDTVTEVVTEAREGKWPDRLIHKHGNEVVRAFVMKAPFDEGEGKAPVVLATDDPEYPNSMVIKRGDTEVAVEYTDVMVGPKGGRYILMQDEEGAIGRASEKAFDKMLAGGTIGVWFESDKGTSSYRVTQA